MYDVKWLIISLLSTFSDDGGGTYSGIGWVLVITRLWLGIDFIAENIEPNIGRIAYNAYYITPIYISVSSA